ncbi:glycoside hydrolase family 43 protein [Aspergillus affinis]|uniref:glycoside hydrolase family 43 protein n=1 Tax=Aspergillus affinis TaxID=1070780 RepID=UPI0022FE1D91|nr:Arabinanase/levansucrase/invertase [Aspergillus affinis]KAI9035371.1 Arabinanase/levansucrase/invertase [Aspergillus affinis]
MDTFRPSRCIAVPTGCSSFFGAARDAFARRFQQSGVWTGPIHGRDCPVLHDSGLESVLGDPQAQAHLKHVDLGRRWLAPPSLQRCTCDVLQVQSTGILYLRPPCGTPASVDERPAGYDLPPVQQHREAGWNVRPFNTRAVDSQPGFDQVLIIDLDDATVVLVLILNIPYHGEACSDRNQTAKTTHETDNYSPSALNHDGDTTESKKLYANLVEERMEPNVPPSPSNETPSTASSNANDKANGVSKPSLTSKPGLSLTQKLSSTWTRKRTWILVASLLGLAIIVVVITVPVVLLTGRTSDDPSYADMANRPLLVVDNFPDPGLFHVNGTWFAYGTNAAINDTQVPHVPLATSTNFKDWTRVEAYDALPTIGSWESSVNHWAPDVIQRDDGKYVLYYSGELKDWRRHHCVGAAVLEGNDPRGPYKPRQEPLVCTPDRGGAIDPSPFRDEDGKLYIVYKVDGNSIGHGGDCNNGIKPIVPVPIMLQELEDDGVTAIGEPVQVLTNEKSDGPLVEAPNLIRTEEGVYYLFFSSHCFTSPLYDIKYAHSTSLKGPYTRASRALLKKGDFGLESPGGATVSVDGTRMVFHANGEDNRRCMYVAGLNITADAPIILRPL